MAKMAETQDWTTTDEIAGVDIVGEDNDERVFEIYRTQSNKWLIHSASKATATGIVNVRYSSRLYT